MSLIKKLKEILSNNNKEKKLSTSFKKSWQSKRYWQK